MQCLQTPASRHKPIHLGSQPARCCYQVSSNRQQHGQHSWTLPPVSPQLNCCAVKPAFPARGRSSKLWRARASSSGNQEFQFKEDNFFRVEFMPHPYGPLVMIDRIQGTVIFRKAEDMFPSEDSETLEVFVGGDTCQAIYHLAARKRPERPMVLDLLWQILERGQSKNDSDWCVLRVAIIELRNDVYIGRLFMGDPVTKQVMWDCDCRPSDGSWLALQTGAPLYIHKDVWREAACPLSQTTGYSLIQTDSQRRGPTSTPFMASNSSLPLTPQHTTPLERTTAADRTLATWGPTDRQSFDITAVRPDDMEVIILLKRELKVAIQEENYVEAIRIRDHPFMITYARMMEKRMGGDREAAWDMLQRLRDMVAQNEAQSDAQAH